MCAYIVIVVGANGPLALHDYIVRVSSVGLFVLQHTVHLKKTIGFLFMYL